MKLIVLIVAVVLIWFVVRTVRQGEVARSRQQAAPQNAPRRKQVAATETIACPKCGAYLPADRPSACARADCPYPKAAEPIRA